MTVQRNRMREILEELRRRGVFIVVGGPWVSVVENAFDGLVDVIFVGEAEETWPRFLEDWRGASTRARYEQAEKTDMTTVPPPRYELVPFREYTMGCIQTSRGCPFQCEFCDIIVIFGRKPRIKTADQVVAEVDAQHRLGAGSSSWSTTTSSATRRPPRRSSARSSPGSASTATRWPSSPRRRSTWPRTTS